LGTLEGKAVLVLGAAFKGGTDDVRQSPAIDVARLLLLEGAKVVVHDPVVDHIAFSSEIQGATLERDPLAAARGVDGILLATDWAEYCELPLAAMRNVAAGSTLVDARNLLDPDTVAAAGFDYFCLGRPRSERRAARPEPIQVAAAGAQ
jgi:UDPglucose 6-dehydrogenase